MASTLSARGKSVERGLRWVRAETPRSLFLRGLGAVFAIAFASLLPQLRGLWGPTGISPASGFLAQVARALPVSERLLRVPTVFWLSSSEGALLCAAWVGLAVSLLLVAGLFPRPCLAALWALYLSFVSVGGVFLGFQWDTLLLETAFCAFVYAPGGPSARRGGGGAVGRLLLWALLFKLMWLSGVVKLASGDPTWRNLTALRFHFWTQPLPNPLALHVANLPAPLLEAMAAVSLAIELAVPFAIFLGRPGRRVAFAAFVALQAGIALTGNYGFFNLLAALLAVPLLDETSPRLRDRALPERLGALALLGLIALPPLAQFLDPAGRVPGLGAALEALAPFETFNTYGLFAVMTTSRPELSLEGSDDLRSWTPYRFRYKAQPGERPAQVAPYQPRLDWQMWFAALGSCAQNPWLLAFADRLLQGSTAVEGLLASTPTVPPRFLRVSIRDLSPDGRGGWRAGPSRPYCPLLSREGGHLVAVEPGG